MPPAISIMDAPEIALVTLPATGKACGSAIGASAWTGHRNKRQMRFHSISIDYAVSLSTQWTGLQRVDHEAVQQIMVACATSVRTSDSAAVHLTPPATACRPVRRAVARCAWPRRAGGADRPIARSAHGAARNWGTA